MPLLDQLNAAGVAPAQQFRCSVFFAQHPDLVEEVKVCRAAGFSWKQIAAQISQDWECRVNSSGLAEYIEGRR